ncbi:MAG: Uma2 family endonuclease [Coleofasciculus sp. S288]|nr:Uma2 family endonuclease [Coleofasciculus sp. S288]
MQKTETPLKLRLWTVEEYHRMAEAGILQPDEKVELIAGQIIKKMSPQGSPHAAAIRRTDRVLSNRLGNQVLIQKQLPIQLNDRSEPEPDVAVVRVDPLDYADHHPTVSDVYLIIEVADTSLKFDCETKAKDYAQSGIADYWVLDVSNRQLHVFREPTENGYQSEAILEEGASISPLQFPGCTIAVSEILPPIIGL